VYYGHFKPLCAICNMSRPNGSLDNKYPLKQNLRPVMAIFCESMNLGYKKPGP